MRGIHRAGSTAVMVLIIILLVSGKTADFDVALEECMQLFVEQRDLLHRRHEVEKAFDEFRWVFSPNLAHKLASEYLPKPERKLRLAPPPMQSQQSAAVTTSSLTPCDEELELESNDWWQRHQAAAEKKSSKEVWRQHRVAATSAANADDADDAGIGSSSWIAAAAAEAPDLLRMPSKRPALHQRPRPPCASTSSSSAAAVAEAPDPPRMPAKRPAVPQRPRPPFASTSASSAAAVAEAPDLPRMPSKRPASPDPPLASRSSSSAAAAEAPDLPPKPSKRPALGPPPDPPLASRPSSEAAMEAPDLPPKQSQRLPPEIVVRVVVETRGSSSSTAAVESPCQQSQRSLQSQRQWEPSAPPDPPPAHIRAKWNRTQESSKKAQMDNDWTCPTCGNVNWFRRGYCIGGRGQCSTPREATWLPGDWFCTCGNHNLARRKVCNRSNCGLPRSKGEVPRF